MFSGCISQCCFPNLHYGGCRSDQSNRHSMLYFQDINQMALCYFFGIPFVIILIMGLRKILRTNTCSISKQKYAKLLLFMLIALIPCAWFLSLPITPMCILVSYIVTGVFPSLLCLAVLYISLMILSNKIKS